MMYFRSTGQVRLGGYFWLTEARDPVPNGSTNGSTNCGNNGSTNGSNSGTNGGTNGSTNGGTNGVPLTSTSPPSPIPPCAGSYPQVQWAQEDSNPRDSRLSRRLSRLLPAGSARGGAVESRGGRLRAGHVLHPPPLRMPAVRFPRFPNSRYGELDDAAFIKSAILSVFLAWEFHLE